MFVNTFFYFFTLILLYCDRLGITKDVYYCLLPTGFFFLSGLNAQPRLRILAGSASAGGVRFLDGGNLRCFSKVRCLSEASSDFWKTLLADSRQPRSQPPTKPRRQAAHASRASLSRTPLSQKKNRPAHTPTRSQKPESQDSINQKHSL